MSVIMGKTAGATAVLGVMLVACAAGRTGGDETTAGGGYGGSAVAGSGGTGGPSQGGAGGGGGLGGGTVGGSGGSAGADGGGGQGGGSTGGGGNGGSGGSVPCLMCSEYLTACDQSPPCPAPSEICSGYSTTVFNGWRNCICNSCPTECELTCSGSGQNLVPDCNTCIDGANAGCAAQLSACYNDN